MNQSPKTAAAIHPPSRSGSAPRLWALLPCAGTGSRAGTTLAKQYQPVAGVTLVQHTLGAFAQVPDIAATLVVVAPGDHFFDALVAGRALADPTQVDSHSFQFKIWNAIIIVANYGGKTRANSVFNGLNQLLALGATRSDWVLVHDAARCLVQPTQITALIKACLPDSVGGLLALKLADTLKSELNGRADSTVNRSDKWLAQTPQMFRIGPLIDALARAGDAVTDEASAMEMMGFKPLLVAGSAQNFKVTYAEDFALAEAILQARQRRAAGGQNGDLNEPAA